MRMCVLFLRANGVAVSEAMSELRKGQSPPPRTLVLGAWLSPGGQLKGAFTGGETALQSIDQQRSALFGRMPCALPYVSR